MYCKHPDKNLYFDISTGKKVRVAKAKLIDLGVNVNKIKVCKSPKKSPKRKSVIKKSKKSSKKAKKMTKKPTPVRFEIVDGRQTYVLWKYQGSSYVDYKLFSREEPGKYKERDIREMNLYLVESGIGRPFYNDSMEEFVVKSLPDGLYREDDLLEYRLHQILPPYVADYRKYILHTIRNASEFNNEILRAKAKINRNL